MDYDGIDCDQMTPGIDCDQMTIALPPVTSAVFLITISLW
jgi:hypothetical protein